MDRKVKLLVGGVGIGVLLAILAITSFGATAEFVTPTDLAENDDYEDQVVKLEGRAVDIENDDQITFDVVDANHTVQVTYDGTMPETMSEGRMVVAEGVYDGETVDAEDLTIRAHEGEGEHPGGYNKTDYDGSDNSTESGGNDSTQDTTDTDSGESTADETDGQ